ncbi:hypothetical protein RAS1_29290 [Phycisphaerae bacterium RAS1]|nr:hypothetical protein RAS1_29290 [Phycisphaerae bacterium RAS1]
MRRAFTLVEMIVVITIIALLLAIAIPGLGTMTSETRFNEAAQTISGVLNRAHFAALADANMVAVRFMPGHWDASDPSQPTKPGERQHLATYNYVGAVTGTGQGSDPFVNREYFERRKGADSIILPDDVWAAPLEALDTGRGLVDGLSFEFGNIGANFVLRATPTNRAFRLDPTRIRNGGPFPNSDDFLLVFDPQSGLRTSRPEMHLLKGFVPGKLSSNDPSCGVDDDVRNREVLGDGDEEFRRYSFSGVALYRRSALLQLGASATGVNRQDYLRRAGKPYLVRRHGGGLVLGGAQ